MITKRVKPGDCGYFLNLRDSLALLGGQKIQRAFLRFVILLRLGMLDVDRNVHAPMKKIILSQIILSLNSLIPDALAREVVQQSKKGRFITFGIGLGGVIMLAR
ncbi:MAG TPA: hypothetical protein VJ952_12265 [Opitutales bacterium]|nr:hypothetical protein [Opitutales bacterium]